MRGDLQILIDALQLIAAGRFSWNEVAIPSYAGVSALVISPVRRTSASLRVTDTGVSIYVEVLDAAWEEDSLDGCDPRHGEVPSFEDQLDWATRTVTSVAKHGLIRVRRKFCFLGRETHLLNDASDLYSWKQRANLKIIHQWDPW